MNNGIITSMEDQLGIPYHHQVRPVVNLGQKLEATLFTKTKEVKSFQFTVVKIGRIPQPEGEEPFYCYLLDNGEMLALGISIYDAVRQDVATGDHPSADVPHPLNGLVTDAVMASEYYWYRGKNAVPKDFAVKRLWKMFRKN